MPQLASLYRRRVHNVLGSLSFKSLKARLVLPWSGRSKDGPRNESDRAHVRSDPRNNLYLETQILGSVQGKGKFLNSGVYSQRQWMD